MQYLVNTQQLKSCRQRNLGVELAKAIGAYAAGKRSEAPSQGLRVKRHELGRFYDVDVPTVGRRIGSPSG